MPINFNYNRYQTNLDYKNYICIHHKKETIMKKHPITNFKYQMIGFVFIYSSSSLKTWKSISSVLTANLYLLNLPVTLLFSFHLDHQPSTTLASFWSSLSFWPSSMSSSVFRLSIAFLSAPSLDVIFYNQDNLLFWVWPRTHLWDLEGGREVQPHQTPLKICSRRTT